MIKSFLGSEDFEGGWVIFKESSKDFVAVVSSILSTIQRSTLQNICEHNMLWVNLNNLNILIRQFRFDFSVLRIPACSRGETKPPCMAGKLCS